METLSTIEALGVLIVWDRIKNYDTFKTLADWLGCYQYIKPNDRGLNSALVREMCNTEYASPNSSELFRLWLRADILECNFSKANQDRIAAWILQD